MGKLSKFKRDGTSFEWYFEKDMAANETVYLKMPTISANKRSVNDIGWQSENAATIYATLSNEVDDALWSKIENGEDINKCVQYLKIVAGDGGGRIVVRANLN